MWPSPSPHSCPSRWVAAHPFVDVGLKLGKGLHLPEIVGLASGGADSGPRSLKAKLPPSSLNFSGSQMVRKRRVPRKQLGRPREGGQGAAVQIAPRGSPLPPTVHRWGFRAFWKLGERSGCLSPRTGRGRLERGGGPDGHGSSSGANGGWLVSEAAGWDGREGEGVAGAGEASASGQGASRTSRLSPDVRRQTQVGFH